MDINHKDFFFEMPPIWPQNDVIIKMKTRMKLWMVDKIHNKK